MSRSNSTSHGRKVLRLICPRSSSRISRLNCAEHFLGARWLLDHILWKTSSNQYNSISMRVRSPNSSASFEPDLRIV